MTAKPLIAIQIQIWRFIAEFQKREGCPPTYREIADGVGLKSPTTVFHHVKALKRAQILDYSPIRHSRFIQLKKQPPKAESEAAG